MNEQAIYILLVCLAAGFFSYIVDSALRLWNWGWWYRHIYLHSIHWYVIRFLKKMQMRILHGGVFCEKCRSPKRLTVHHVTYKRLGHERLSDLQVICFGCHRPGSGRI